MSTSSDGYRHGDLRAHLITSAIDLLEAGETYSLRAVARRAGVSAAAPYRHFPDRQALDSAVAVEGFRDLGEVLGGILDHAESDTGLLGDLGVAYVGFALRRPAVFHLMFGRECDDEDSDRVTASRQVHALLDDVLTRLYPDGAPDGLATALWGLAHGLACLHLDGKYRPGPPEEVADRVRTAVAAVFPSRGYPPDTGATVVT